MQVWGSLIQVSAQSAHAEATIGSGDVLSRLRGAVSELSGCLAPPFNVAGFGLAVLNLALDRTDS